MLKVYFLMMALALSSIAFGNGIGPIAHQRKDTPKLRNSSVGRYLYVGNLSKFNAQDIEVTVSKMSLTNRVTLWVSQAKIDQYAQVLFDRWEKIDTALQDPAFIVHPLIQLSDLNTSGSLNNEAWIKIADQYTAHVLEGSGSPIYKMKRGAKSLMISGEDDSYREAVSQAILRYYFNSLSLRPDVLRVDNRSKDLLISTSNSRKIFATHLGHLFTKTDTKPGYVGYLTLVYPIAATVEGPFDQPSERISKMMNYGSMDARWHSDKWIDEFGGMPFLMINSSGVAFHGPITNYAPLDVWYLRRGYVSHGCHRMDSSDILELRAIFPDDLREAGKIKITILNYFDVTDWNLDGKKEVIDVKYYNLPTSIGVAKGKTVDEVIVPYRVENQMKSYFANHAYAKKCYNAVNDTIKNAPKYVVKNGALAKEGVHPELPLARFNYRPNRIFQYDEEGIRLQGYNDQGGKYPPGFSD